MEFWYAENHSKNVKFNIRIKDVVYSHQSEFQKIDVFDSFDFGRILVLDGYIMLTEKDEFIYHEMITHVPMSVNPKIENVLIIGAGDGGVVRELCKYDTIKNIDMAEIDKEVVEVSKKYLPFTSCSLEDKRVNLYFKDGLSFVRSKENEYDLIIVDSTDPFGPGEGLFTKEFYGNCYKALVEDGILVNQHESPFYDNDANAMKRIHSRIVQSFDMAKVYQAHIPTYPSGHWLFGFSSKKYHPIKDFDERNFDGSKIKTKYYNAALHKGAFALPTYVEEMLKSVE